MATFVRRNEIPWPVIVDGNRSLEKQCGVGPICLQNIWQVQIITADGSMVRGNANDIEQAARQALRGARWNIDPAQIPDRLHATWLSVEFGNYAAVAKKLNQYASSRQAEVKDAAVKLNAYVRRKLDEQIQSAEQSLRDGDKWQAYRAYKWIQYDFRGFDIPPDVATQVKALSTSDMVKTKLAAQIRKASAE